MEAATAHEATINYQERSNDADKIIRNYAIGSAAAGAIPAPGIDLAAITAIQLKMLHSLSSLYNVSFKKELGKSAIASLLTGVVPLASRQTISSIIKAVPLVGPMVSMLTMPALSGASSYAIGKVFMQHFESGGNFLTFDPAKARGTFEKELDNGKEMIAAAKTDDKSKVDLPSFSSDKSSTPKKTI
ncbi:MAG: DUF697 domain-containing protein [Magnetococcus sp. DMHC-1]